MGIVLVLSITYLVSTWEKIGSSAESSKTLGIWLVTISLLFNLAQNAVDLARGWNVSSRIAVEHGPNA